VSQDKKKKPSRSFFQVVMLLLVCLGITVFSRRSSLASSSSVVDQSILKSENKVEYENDRGVNVNFGGFGFDFSPDGGGVTIFGLRVGGGKNGAEIGANVGLGVQVDGKGAYAGTGAKITVGKDGVKGSAGAKAVGIDQEAGAGVEAGLRFDGTFYSDAVSTTTSELNSNKGKWEEAVRDLTKVKENRDIALSKEQLAKNEVADDKKDMDTKVNQQNELRKKRNMAGANKTDLLNSKTSINIKVGDAKLLVESAKSKLNRATKDNKYGEMLREKGVVEEQTALINDLEEEIKEIDTKLKPILEEFKQSGKALIEAQNAVVNGRKELKAKTTEWHKSKANYKSAETDFEVATKHVVEKKKVYKDANKAYLDAKEDQRKYQASM